MNNQIDVTFNPKTKRLVMKVPFHLSDVAREFASRRFDPKTKTWTMPLVKANITHLGLVRHKYDFVIDQAAADAVRDFEKISAVPPEVPFPYHLYDFTKSETGFTPMKHQNKMLDKAWGRRATAWFAKMGTGKTFATIHLLCARWMGGEINAAVIICPSTLRSVWVKEFKKYSTIPYDIAIHRTAGADMNRFYADRPRDRLQVLLVSVEGLGVSPALYDSVCGYYPGRRVFTVVDESSRIKNPKAKRTERVIELGAVSEYRLILNGTPIALGVQDLYSQYEFLDPNIIGMGDYWAFRTKYLELGGFEGKQIIGVKNMEELMTSILPYTCEVGKDVLDLPPKWNSPRTLQITELQRDLLRLVVKGKWRRDEPPPLIKVTNSLEKILRCRQIVGGWLPKARVEWVEVEGEPQEVWHTEMEALPENPKFDSLLELIEDNFQGTKFIIWSTFRHEIELIRDALGEKYGRESVEAYYGATDIEERSKIEDRYCNDPKMRFFVANPATAGLGLTLISGENDLMVYYSGTNAYIDRAQSEDRAHRIGQKNQVVITDLIAEGTVDEAIAESIAAKMDIEEYLMTRIAQGTTLDDILLKE